MFGPRSRGYHARFHSSAAVKVRCGQDTCSRHERQLVANARDRVRRTSRGVLTARKREYYCRFPNVDLAGRCRPRFSRRRPKLPSLLRTGGLHAESSWQNIEADAAIGSALMAEGRAIREHDYAVPDVRHVSPCSPGFRGSNVCPLRSRRLSIWTSESVLPRSIASIRWTVESRRFSGATHWKPAAGKGPSSNYSPVYRMPARLSDGVRLRRPNGPEVTCG